MRSGARRNAARRWKALLPLLCGAAGVLLGACRCEPPPPLSDEGATSVPLWLQAPRSVSLPDHARPHRPEPPERIPLGPWSPRGRKLSASNPVRPRNLFFNRPPEGMQVLIDGQEIPHAYFRVDDSPYWTFDDDQIVLHGYGGRVPDGAASVVYPAARERERALNPGLSGLAPTDFIRGLALSDRTSRSGLMLPAPADITWDVEVPPRAELIFHHALVAPEIADAPPSDGADVTITAVTADGEAHALWSAGLEDDTFRPAAVDLSAYAGQTITIRITVSPRAHNRFDYVFLAEPFVLTRKGRPKRVVMVFVDTLRADHVGAFGYPRQTTPAIDAQAARGVRFTQARSVAPWTLPSARTMVTGVQPELYFVRPTLQERLAQAGLPTAMFAGNLYLGPKFRMNLGWGLHDVELLPMARTQVDKALAWLHEHRHHDAFVLLHLMDPHLPYQEPASYRALWAGPAPARLGTDEPQRPHVVRARLRSEDDRQYLRDRYDQSIRYADDELARVFEVLGPDDVVVVVSDHGEEFWDHGDFEHGHTLYDELLRVPFVVAAPGLPAGTAVDAPVSLLDVAPTILDLLGLGTPLDPAAPLDPTVGTSLLPAMQGSAEALEALRARPQAFGRPLYGHEQWGSLSGSQKYQATADAERLFDLASDPGEEQDVFDPAHREEAVAPMRDALGRGVVKAFRIAPAFTSRPPPHPLEVEVHLPGGIAHAWVGEDPTMHSFATVELSDDGTTARAVWEARWRGSRDVWIVPTQPSLPEAARDLTLVARSGTDTERHDLSDVATGALAGEPRVLTRHRVGERAWELGFAVTPLPPPEGAAVEGYHPDAHGALVEMGYAERDEPTPAAAERDEAQDASR